MIGEIVTQTESSISDAHIDTQTKCIIYRKLLGPIFCYIKGLSSRVGTVEGK